MKPNKKHMLLAVELAAKKFKVLPSEVLSRSRTEPVCLARRCALWAIQNRMGVSAQIIGDTLGIRQGTVYYNIVAVRDAGSVGDSASRDLCRKAAEISMELHDVLRKEMRVIIEVVCGVVFIRSKPEDIEVEIITSKPNATRTTPARLLH